MPGRTAFVLALLIGVVANVGVSWALVWFQWPEWSAAEQWAVASDHLPKWIDVEPNAEVAIAVYAATGLREVSYTTEAPWFRDDVTRFNDVDNISLGQEWNFLQFDPAARNRDHVDQLHVRHKETKPQIVESGWPLRSFVAHQSGSRVRVRWGISVAREFNHVQPGRKLWMKIDRVVPLRPMFPGFIANTLFYAALIIVAMIARRAAFGAWRARRGRCRACGYIVREQRRCTECGLMTGK